MTPCRPGSTTIFPELIEKYDVPAASIAVFADGEVSTAAAGVLNLNTGVEATIDSVFQVGSITKLWTTTLIMQLVAEGKIDLDRPVREYLPEFKLADEEAAAVVTPRHLLTTPAGSPVTRSPRPRAVTTRSSCTCVTSYPGWLRRSRWVPGSRTTMSGFVILGRIAEVLRGKPYHELVREHIVVPLELEHVATIPDEALLYRAALGHISPTPGAPPQAAPAVEPRARDGAGRGVAGDERKRPDRLRPGVSGCDACSTGRPSTRCGTPTVDVPQTGGLAEHWGLGWTILR